ncbi:uncharacterized protein BJ171DRAFT_489466 [Polychytrium aggregatum]|uniref:uncharacterized protein n=1 Tax=Polychytrium aggregatum TaxID=110093 RepID=UPI0022FE232A|nr:uncharacterized protein BJ171DRAFT_489466 [Polychytrium aggregatum]KAI9208594.1 hypothetical protein BJ171DRAFT_489466 [Polychytrium aggregatum]
MIRAASQAFARAASAAPRLQLQLQLVSGFHSSSRSSFKHVLNKLDILPPGAHVSSSTFLAIDPQFAQATFFAQHRPLPLTTSPESFNPEDPMDFEQAQAQTQTQTHAQTHESIVSEVSASFADVPEALNHDTLQNTLPDLFLNSPAAHNQDAILSSFFNGEGIQPTQDVVVVPELIDPNPEQSLMQMQREFFQNEVQAMNIMKIRKKKMNKHKWKKHRREVRHNTRYNKEKLRKIGENREKKEPSSS